MSTGQSPTSVDVASVIGRLPSANVVLTAQLGRYARPAAVIPVPRTGADTSPLDGPGFLDEPDHPNDEAEPALVSRNQAPQGGAERPVSWKQAAQPGHDGPVSWEQDPQPGQDGPVSWEQARQPGQDGPVSWEQARQPARDAPVSWEQAPQPARDAPVSWEQAPQPGHDGPVSWEQAPQPAHEAPVSAKQAPQPGRDAPVSWKQAAQPGPGHDTPVSTKQAPQPTHDAPVSAKQAAHPAPNTPVSREERSRSDATTGRSTAPPTPVPEDPAALPEGAPVSPAPIGPPLDPADLPSGEALGDEIAAELSAQAKTTQDQPAPRRPETGEWRGIVLITGTDTDVGKTIVTAAVAAAAQSSGLRVAVVKPGQTGIVTGAPTDIDVINRLAAPDTARTLAEYPEPMAPLAAATVAEMPPLELYEVVDAIRTEADKHDLVLVEGAGGLLVPMGVRPSGESWTLADLATTLGVRTIVVARAGLGTLNHTALTLEALSRRGVPAGVVIGAWPADPELVHWANLSELVPHLVGALPEGAGRMDPGVFRRSAPGWLTPALYGVLDNWRVWAEETGDGHH